ncbi:MAG: DMT family transporter [Synechococcaceae cyanobacterium RL_1_2]|nr:DMT family transporter [Synechococcaceae cyanobacterium RL_1_2]
MNFNYGLGLAIGLTSASLAATFMVLNSQFTQIYHPLHITLMEMIGATITSGLIYLGLQPTFAPAFPQAFNFIPTLTDWGYLLILALVCTVYAFWESINLLKTISAFELNLTVNLEPIYGILLAVLWFQDQERMTPGFYGGMAIILLAVVSYPWLKKSQRQA